MDDFFFSLLLAGISVGAVYALIALGLNLTFWTTKALNFGQGSLMMLCAMLTVYLAAQGLALFLAVLGALAIIAGFGIFLQGVAAKWFGSQAVAFPDILFSAQDYVSVFGQYVSLQYLVVLVVA